MSSREAADTVITRVARRAAAGTSASVPQRSARGSSSGRRRKSRSWRVSTRANGPVSGAKFAVPCSTSTRACAAARATPTSSPAAHASRPFAVARGRTTRRSTALSHGGGEAAVSRFRNAVSRRSGRAARSAGTSSRTYVSRPPDASGTRNSRSRPTCKLVDVSVSTTHSGGPGPPLPGGGRRTRTTSMRAATAAGSDDPCNRRIMRRTAEHAHYRAWRTARQYAACAVASGRIRAAAPR